MIALVLAFLTLAAPTHAAAHTSSSARATAASPPPAAHAHAAAHSSARPYREIQVRVRTRDAQTLAGTLTLPLGARRPPAMLLLSTATAQDRDASGEHGAYRPFRQIADTLARVGIAVLRLDDRGMGKSTGVLDTLNTADRANDAVDAVKFLRSRPDVNRARIGLLGHSEGALIAAMVAADDTALKAVILMASTALPGEKLVEWQQRVAISRSSIPLISRDHALKQAMLAWRDRAAHDRWANFFDSYDPVATARRVRTPALVLQGDADPSVPTGHAGAIVRAMQQGGNPDATERHFPYLDHAFLDTQKFDNGVPRNDDAFRLGSEVLGAIAEWAKAKLR